MNAPWKESLSDILEWDAGPESCLRWVKDNGPDVLALVAALKFGLDLYGYDGPDGPWPIEKRREFDRLAREALTKAGALKPAAPYPFCRTPAECAGKGYCPKEFACND